MISSSLVFREYAARSAVKRQQQSYRQTKYRYLALFFACMIMLGDAYCFDNPMALQSPIQEQFGITNFQFNLLYTVYSLPNIVLPFFGGLLIDKIGARLAILIFSTIILIGQLVCYFGALYSLFWLMIVGRVIFGMGSESLNTSQNSIMAQWFKDKEMSFAIGLCISVPKIGSAINSLISPQIVERGGTVADAFLVGGGFIIMSYISGLILMWMDKESDKRETQSRALLQTLIKEKNEQLLSKKKPKKKKKVHEGTQLKDFDEADKSKTDESRDDDELAVEGKKKGEHHEEEEEHEPVEEIKLADIAKMPGTFWIVIIICMLTEALFVPFLDNGNDFFQVRFGFSPGQAGEFLIIPYVISALMTPFFGVIVDKVGRRGLLIILTSLVFLTTHLLLLFLTCSSMCYVVSLPLLFLGLCFAFYSSVVIPSVPAVVPQKLIGTAFGLMGVFQNTALALFPMITGTIFNQFSNIGPGLPRDENRGYEYQSMFFVGMSVFLLFIAIALVFVDKAGGRQLSKPGHKATA